MCSKTACTSETPSRAKFAPASQQGRAPIGTAYIRAAKAAGPITRDEWIKAAVVGGVFIVFEVGAPNVLGRDKNSSYPFTVKQIGPDKVTAGAEQPA